MEAATPRQFGLRAPRLGDSRLNRRQPALLKALFAKPGTEVPEVFADDSKTEAFYRFVRNARIAVEDVIKPHITEVAASLPPEPVVIVHDSTNIVHACAQGANDVYDLGTGPLGYMAHVSLAVVEREKRPVGIVGLETVDRPDGGRAKQRRSRSSRELEHEGQRWWRGALQCEELVGERAPAIHVMDSEGDSYETLKSMEEEGLGFVVRAGQLQRLVTTSDGKRQSLDSLLCEVEASAQREVPLSSRTPARATLKGKKAKRNRQERKARVAKLHIGALSASMIRPHIAPRSWPERLNLNLVRVWEPEPPSDEEPVHWLLWTTMAVGTVEEILRVVDVYCLRWLIEELFKALKTGCRFEKRRFESKLTSERALALFLPIAAYILALRAVAREDSQAPASTVLSPDHILALRASAKPLPKRLTVKAAMMSIAKLGGHLKSNGNPGWLVLARGMERLQERAQTWRRAREFYEKQGGT